MTISPINLPRTIGWSLDSAALASVSSLETGAASTVGNKDNLSAEKEEESEREGNKEHVSHMHITCFSTLI